jgi:hypothetical protein
MKNTEFEKFDKTMDAILRADPKAVKAAMEAEFEASKRERQARGERKRGRKPKTLSVSDRASSGKD